MEKAKFAPALREARQARQKITELRARAPERGFTIDENSLYSPNEPQFSEEQLSERLAKALRRA